MPTKKDSDQESTHYLETEYDSKERFCSYWHQIDEIISCDPKNLLEIGKGNGFVAKYLQDRGINITDLDLLPQLKPHVTGSVLSIPFRTASFDVVSCCEVLEHLPFNEFTDALKEIARVSQGNIILSLPDVTTVYRFNIELPRIRPIKKLIPHPFPRPKPYKSDGQHHWEIGWKGYPLKKISSEIASVNLNIIKTFRVYEFYYHRFFVLEKKKNG